MNAVEKHEQNVVDSLNAMKTMMSDLEAVLKDSVESRREYNSYMRAQDAQIELDFGRLDSLQHGYRFALTDETERLREQLYYYYRTWYAGLGWPNDVSTKQLDDLAAITLDTARKLQNKLGEVQIKQENAKKDRFTKMVDRVTPEVGSLKAKFLGFPLKRKVQLAESKFNVEYEQQKERQAEQQMQQLQQPDDGQNGQQG